MPGLMNGSLVNIRKVNDNRFARKCFTDFLFFPFIPAGNRDDHPVTGNGRHIISFAFL